LRKKKSRAKAISTVSSDIFGTGEALNLVRIISRQVKAECGNEVYHETFPNCLCDTIARISESSL